MPPNDETHGLIPPVPTAINARPINENSLQIIRKSFIFLQFLALSFCHAFMRTLVQDLLILQIYKIQGSEKDFLDNVPNCNITCRGVRQVQTASAGLEDFADLHVLYLE